MYRSFEGACHCQLVNYLSDRHSRPIWEQAARVSSIHRHRPIGQSVGPDDLCQHRWVITLDGWAFRRGEGHSHCTTTSIGNTSNMSAPASSLVRPVMLSDRSKHHDPQSLRKLYMNYIHSLLEYLHLKLICIPSFAHDIHCTTFVTNHIREGENPDLPSFWVPQKEYEKFRIAFSW